MTNYNAPLPKLSVGDELLRVRVGLQNGDPPKTVKVSKVGRIWGTAMSVDDHSREIGRFNLKTGAEDAGGYSPHAYYMTEEDYAAREERGAALKALGAHGVQWGFGKGHSQHSTATLLAVLAAFDEGSKK